ncbi:Conserved_hypothetical protein [Hexamita inflata]|uniref:Uncharacterized protein n=1 Tax=Hexamita inflata TaxID=28002 RepID=A0AA86P8L6_9EUKA|nr:Conserved hypothetical protein [Hexamita inflata]
MNNLTSDEVTELKGAKYPLQSFQFVGLFGSPGSGKTYQLMKLSQEVVRWSKETTEYNLDKPELCNGPVTHNIYITPTAFTDNTLNKGSNNITVLEFTDQTLTDLSDQIRDMSKTEAQVRDLQNFIRTFMRDTDFKDHRELLTHPFYSQLIQCIKAVEDMKTKYPELRVKEQNQKIINQLNKLYNFDGYFIRRPKIVLSIDDAAGSKLFTQGTNNSFYKLICTRRHLSVFFIGLAFQTISDSFKRFKTQMNSMILFRGLPPEAVEDMFECVSSLASPIFDKKTFLQLYRQTIGYNEEEFNKKNNFRFNFLFIQSQPNVGLSIGYDQPITK